MWIFAQEKVGGSVIFSAREGGVGYSGSTWWEDTARLSVPSNLLRGSSPLPREANEIFPVHLQRNSRWAFRSFFPFKRGHFWMTPTFDFRRGGVQPRRPKKIARWKNLLAYPPPFRIISKSSNQVGSIRGGQRRGESLLAEVPTLTRGPVHDSKKTRCSLPIHLLQILCYLQEIDGDRGGLWDGGSWWVRFRRMTY